jgi:uncharacterized membrane protein YdjX (TVP38/TMEM64 family)
MESLDLLWTLPDQLASLAAFLQDETSIALVLLGLTFLGVSFGVPGVILPLSLSSGALLGGTTGMLVVLAGVVLGSQALFLAARTLMRARVKARFKNKVEEFERYFSRHGVLYIVGLRLIGAPHFLVTSGCALTSVRADRFAAASLIGFLPVVAVAAAAGAAF